MSNYTLNNVRRLITHIDETDYWDMHLNTDTLGDGDLNPNCLNAHIDTSNDECLDGDNLTSLKEYSYINACNQGLKLENIGYTGVDNGLFKYRKDRITNKEFYDIYTSSTYKLESGDTRLHLHKVSGNTLQYEYPVGINDDGSIKLNGGFYQGFFRSGDNYQVLPSSLQPGEEWNVDVNIRKVNYDPESDKTLNDANPDNKGIFFYIGTRAENKWIYLYDKIPMKDTECGCCIGGKDEDMFNLIENDELFDLVEDDIALSSQTFTTTTGMDVSSPNDDYIMTDNKFLMFDRTKDGITLANYKGDEVVRLEFKKRRFDKNLFLYMNRTPSGYTANDIDLLESGYTETYDDTTFYNDIYNNALAFIVKDDGSIGYRYLVKDCEADSIDKCKVLEGYSYPGLIQEDIWVNIRVRIIGTRNDNMRFMFYVNGKLKYITTEVPKLNLRALDELNEKQEGVAYNISIGGGTQGLAETIMPNYMLNPTQKYPLERYFAGTFIGDLKEFNFYTC